MSACSSFGVRHALLFSSSFQRRQLDFRVTVPVADTRATSVRKSLDGVLVSRCVALRCVALCCITRVSPCEHCCSRVVGLRESFARRYFLHIGCHPMSFPTLPILPKRCVLLWYYLRELGTVSRDCIVTSPLYFFVAKRASPGGSLSRCGIAERGFFFGKANAYLRIWN